MSAVTKKESARPTADGAVAQRQFVSPEVTIREAKEAYTLQAEMPGVNKDGLEITIEGNELTIVGRRQGETLNAQVLCRESCPLDYRRLFEIDPVLDTGKISARMDQGVLTLLLPKQESGKPRKVRVSD